MVRAVAGDGLSERLCPVFCASSLFLANDRATATI